MPGKLELPEHQKQKTNIYLQIHIVTRSTNKMNNTSNSLARKYCFTINTDAQLFYDELGTIFEAKKKTIQYICGQIEEAETGQLHFQGYCQLKRTQRRTWMSKNIRDGGHYEKQKAEVNAAARNYCMKEDTMIEPFIEYGTFVVGQGKRSDLTSFRDAILGGSRKIDLLDSHLKEMARYPKFYNMVRSLRRPTRTEDLVVRLNYGTTGLGKTKYAYDNFDNELYPVPVTSGTLWFDGCDLHPVVLLDDFCGAASKVSLNYTLRLLDRYPIQVPNKGGFTWWMPRLIILTTNIHPRLWYKWDNREGQYDALLRRITEVWYYTADRDPLLLLDENRKNFDANLLSAISYSPAVEEERPIVFPASAAPLPIDVDTIMDDSSDDLFAEEKAIIADIVLTLSK